MLKCEGAAKREETRRGDQSEDSKKHSVIPLYSLSLDIGFERWYFQSSYEDENGDIVTTEKYSGFVVEK